MDHDSHPPARPRARPVLAAAIRSLASMKLAVVVLLVLSVVLAWATLLEARRGPEFVRWHVYQSTWFIGLLALLAANILAAMLFRLPWKRAHAGFVAAHAGLLLLLAGAVATFLRGIDGYLTVEEGQTADSIVLTAQSQFTVHPVASARKPTMCFTFKPGPSDWSPEKSLRLGELGGVELRVLKFFRHARVDETWMADRADDAVPALRLAPLGAAKTLPAAEQWVTADRLGAETRVGPARCEFLRLATESQLEDVRSPPRAEELGELGTLSVHYQDRIQRIAVAENLRRQVSLGDSGMRIEIVEYLANAKIDPAGGFVSAGQRPENPLLQVAVNLPDRERPVRELAFARYPLLNLDGIHGWSSPVKLWYHHRTASPAATLQFLQTPSGRLYCRTAADGVWKWRGEVRAGDVIESSAGFKLAIREHLPRANKIVDFRPVELARGQTEGPEAAALVELAVGGERQRVWLKRRDGEHGTREVDTSLGRLAIAFDYVELPLGFSLRLVDFQRARNPGHRGDASYASVVQVIDPHEAKNETRRIAMNEPLVHGRYSFYQSGFHELPQGEATVLTVGYDPGRPLKYSGSIVLSLGILIMLCSRASRRRPVR